jgi:hypothetical protein
MATADDEMKALQAELVTFETRSREFLEALESYKGIAKDPAFVRIIDNNLTLAKNANIPSPISPPPVPPVPPGPVPPGPVPPNALATFIALKQKLASDMAKEAVLVKDEEKILNELQGALNVLNTMMNDMRNKVYDEAKLHNIFSAMLFSAGNFKLLSKKIKIYDSDIMDLINNHLNPLLRTIAIDKKLQGAIDGLSKSLGKLKGFMQEVINRETKIETQINLLPGIDVFLTDAEKKEPDPVKKEAYIIANANKVGRLCVELMKLIKYKTDDIKFFKDAVLFYNRDTAKKLDYIGNLIPP